ncbi:peptidoglycan-binding protein [Shimazuella sp. AN120528]|uniref:peptidoglycan-binding protein n=1 Tax=Shimazuella soli TaxID=1892854 RepID=UPI001F0FABE3|nr:peptidoglycan-binding protein [Shimazuella soli]MCH5585730.1 peptidoglycan-binding protein [Shimazuella soli]
MSKLSSLFKKESPTSSKLAKWLELTSIGVICTFGGFFVYHYTQTFAQSPPAQQQPSVQKLPIVMNTVVSKDANEQMMENLPSKSLETTLKVKPIPYDGTDQNGDVPLTGDSSTPQGSSDTVELPDTSIASQTPSTTPNSTSTDLADSQSSEPTNPVEIITDPDYSVADEHSGKDQVKGKEDNQHSNPIIAALQKPKPEPAAKEKPTPIQVITKPVTSKPSTSTSKPSTSTSKPSTSTSKPSTSTSKPSTSTSKPSTSTSKPSTSTSKPSTSTSKPSTSTSKPSTSTSKPSTSTSKPSKPKAPYAVQKTFPGTKYFKTGAKNKFVTQLGHMLVAAGYGKYYKVGPGPEWTSADLKNTQAFQRAQGWTGGDADGYPGPETWKRLYNKYYTKYSH